MLTLTAQTTSNNTALVLWPETALYSRYGYNEADLQHETNLVPVFQYLNAQPHVSIFTGIESYNLLKAPTTFSRIIPGTNTHFEAYNGALLVDSKGVQALTINQDWYRVLKHYPGFFAFWTPGSKNLVELPQGMPSKTIE